MRIKQLCRSNSYILVSVCILRAYTDYFVVTVKLFIDVFHSFFQAEFYGFQKKKLNFVGIYRFTINKHHFYKYWSIVLVTFTHHNNCVIYWIALISNAHKTNCIEKLFFWVCNSYSLRNEYVELVLNGEMVYLMFLILFTPILPCLVNSPSIFTDSQTDSGSRSTTFEISDFT